MISSEKDAYLRLHLAVLIAGGTGLFGQLITINELPLVCLRVLLGSLMLGIIMGARKMLHRMAWRKLLKICGCGVLLSVHWVFYYGSIKAANISIGAVCFALVGFMTAVVEPLICKQRPSYRELLLGLLSVVGIGLIFGFEPRYRLGIGLGIISSLIYTAFSLCSKRVQASSGESSSTMLLYEMIGGFVVLSLAVPVYTALFPCRVIPSLSDTLWLLLFASVFTIVPFLLQLQALRHISAFTVNLTYNLEPVYTILLAILFFHEATQLNASFWIGISLIIFAVGCQAWSTYRHAKLRQ